MNFKRKLVFSTPPKDWSINRNEFYNIDPNSDESIEDLETLLYFEEDLLAMTFKNYHLDLGWYGSDDIENYKTGFMLVLFRGPDWNNCELLELFRTQSVEDVILEINRISKLVSNGIYSEKNGYKIEESESNFNFIGEHSRFSVSQSIDLK